jgi:hypothetical protein
VCRPACAVAATHLDAAFCDQTNLISKLAISLAAPRCLCQTAAQMHSGCIVKTTAPTCTAKVGVCVPLGACGRAGGGGGGTAGRLKGTPTGQCECAPASAPANHSSLRHSGLELAPATTICAPSAEVPIRRRTEQNEARPPPPLSAGLTLFFLRRVLLAANRCGQAAAATVRAGAPP